MFSLVERKAEKIEPSPTPEYISSDIQASFKPYSALLAQLSFFLKTRQQILLVRGCHATSCYD
jgi:hypothetical protein